MGRKSNQIVGGLIAATFLWGGNNVATKHLVDHWPPIWTSCTRFLISGLLLLTLARYTPWFGTFQPVTPELKKALWWKGSLSFTIYILSFIWALHFSTAANMGLLFATSPVWALLWEIRQVKRPELIKRLAAATLTLLGVAILFQSSAQNGETSWLGNGLGLLAAILWTLYSRVCRSFGHQLSSAQINGHNFVRTFVWLLPFAIYDHFNANIPMKASLWATQIYSIIGAGVFAFAFWTNALRHWPTSRVMLFINLIPLTTVLCGRFFLNEIVGKYFWWSMMLVMAGVFLGLTDLERLKKRTIS
jgi:drug/metabolite transporter (DMT)-like permease